MTQWSSTVHILAPIEQVWTLFDGTLAHTQKIMPQVEANEPVTITDEKVGSVYRQTYQEGRRTETYEVETIAYCDLPGQKQLRVSFTLANMFDITAEYILIRHTASSTIFRYTVTNRPTNPILRWMLLFASDKTVKAFTQRVKLVAESKGGD
ncbi:SRPBCC family protein [Bacillus daqingensis]|uniref:SRPBCC family protein n=1 Tax=Bacillus daqingensis TaxID=872396 RepID=A0ABV9NSM4_9BACI